VGPAPGARGPPPGRVAELLDGLAELAGVEDVDHQPDLFVVGPVGNRLADGVLEDVVDVEAQLGPGQWT
jgi:hypothetical protein